MPLLLRRLLGLLSLALVACSSTTGDGTCSDGRLSCVGECVQAAANLLHCGACGNVCEVGEDCSSGQCSCVSGQSLCPSGCTDVQEDASNCGMCGAVCAAGEVCSDGGCATACAVGLQKCGTTCADPATSVLHCGNCETSCDAGQVCEAGVCQCTQGRADCGDGCTDVTEDPLNCGGCGVVCPAGQLCAASACQALDGAGGTGSGGAATGTGGATASGGAVSGDGGLGSGGLGSGGQGSGGLASGGQGSGGGLTGSGGSSGDCTATGFYVAGGMLYDANCNEFIMRGVNYPYAWYSTRDTQADFAAIAATGANAIRLVMATGDRWDKTSAAAITNLIAWAKASQMIAVLEVHDVTGYAEQAESVPLSSAQAYWTGSDITGVLIGQEAYVLVNIANEPNGNDTSGQWSSSHVTAVEALRAAGLHHTLVVDAPNWGQDWENILRDDVDGLGTAIWDADAEKNLVFSVHMYQEFSTDSDVTTFYNSFLANYEAPLIVGEFAADHGSNGDVAEATIMTFAESLGIGYLGWSWSGNGSGLETLDIAQNFDASSLSAWGNTLINGPSGLQETGEVCSIFQ